jgi:CubicO group peptidase (beta-lactamase class C family)
VKSRRFLSTLVLALSVCIAPLPLYAQSTLAEAQTPAQYAHAIELARTLIEAVMEESGTPGMSVAVGIDGRIVWSEGFGYADVEQRIPVWEETKFRIGSVSKPVTAAAVGLLVQQGKLDLDAPVQRYVPSFPEKRWPITTRLVAGHLAGVRHYAGDEFLSARRYSTVLEGLEIFQNDTLLFQPGTRYSYSSYGWNLVSAVVEGAAGEEFLSYMQTNVFDPLGLTHTTPDHTDSIIPHRTRFYERAEDGAVLNAPYVDNSYKWAGGGFLSTPEDLLRFGFAHLGSEFLAPHTIAELWTPQTLANGRSTGYGIGWGATVEDGQVTRASHGGGSVGGTTAFMLYPQERAGIAIVGNMSQAPTGGLLPNMILQTFLQPEMLVAQEAGPDIAGSYECSAFSGEQVAITGTLDLGGSPAEYWGHVTWSNGTHDRVVYSLSAADATWIVTVDNRATLTAARFTTVGPDEISGTWTSQRSGELTCNRVP